MLLAKFKIMPAVQEHLDNQKEIVHRQSNIEDLLSTDTPGGLTDVVHAISNLPQSEPEPKQKKK